MQVFDLEPKKWPGCPTRISSSPCRRSARDSSSSRTSCVAAPVPFVREDVSPATMHLIVNLVSSTILQLVLDPPTDTSERELLDELTLRLEGWIRADGAP